MRHLAMPRLMTASNKYAYDREVSAVSGYPLSCFFLKCLLEHSLAFDAKSTLARLQGWYHVGVRAKRSLWPCSTEMMSEVGIKIDNGMLEWVKKPD